MSPHYGSHLEGWQRGMVLAGLGLGLISMMSGVMGEGGGLPLMLGLGGLAIHRSDEQWLKKADLSAEERCGYGPACAWPVGRKRQRRWDRRGWGARRSVQPVCSIIPRMVRLL